MTNRGSDERLETLISLARNNPQLATRLLSELPPEHRPTLIAALARPPRKAVPRGQTNPEATSLSRSNSAPTDAQSAFNAQLNAFAKTIARVS